MNSPFSVDNPVSTSVASDPPMRICAPGYVRSRPNTPTSVMLSWDEPYSACPLCPDAIGYEVVIEGLPKKTVTRPPCEITGLTANASYSVYVTAIAAGNNVSEPSFHRIYFTPSPPSQPGTPEISDLTFSSATLKWAPSVDNGVGSIRYRVYLNDFLIGQVNQPSINLSHLRNDVNYRIKVVAVNAVGTSQPACVTFRTLLRPPSNLKLKHLAGTCRLSWDPNFGRYPSHVVSINGNVFTTGRGSVGYYFKLADLSPGPAPHHFNIAVFAELDGVVSEVSELEVTISDDVPPSKPGAPVVSNITDTSATLTWEPSSDNVGVTGYRVFLNSVPGLSLVQDTHYTFNSLASGSYYYCRVRARDEDGNLSAFSERTVFKTTGQAPTPRPSAPEDVHITPSTSTTAKLEWSVVEEEAATTGVRIMINDERYMDVYLGIVTSLVLRDLIPDVEYSIAVHAFDRHGQLSEPATLVYEPKDITPPSVPENLREIASTVDSVTLAWEESTDDVSMYGYVIYNNREYFDSTPLTQYTAVDLLPGSYSFDVCALDAFGNASEPNSITVDIGVPGPPRNFRYTPAVAYKLEWDAPVNTEDIIDYTIIIAGPYGKPLWYQKPQRILRPPLLPKTRYEVTITANNAVGSSRPLVCEMTTI